MRNSDSLATSQSVRARTDGSTAAAGAGLRIVIAPTRRAHAKAADGRRLRRLQLGDDDIGGSPIEGALDVVGRQRGVGAGHDEDAVGARGVDPDRRHAARRPRHSGDAGRVDAVGRPGWPSWRRRGRRRRGSRPSPHERPAGPPSPPGWRPCHRSPGRSGGRRASLRRRGSARSRRPGRRSSIRPRRPRRRSSPSSPPVADPADPSAFRDDRLIGSRPDGGHRSGSRGTPKAVSTASTIVNGSPPFVEFVAITRSAPGTTTMRWPNRPSAVNDVAVGREPPLQAVRRRWSPPAPATRRPTTSARSAGRPTRRRGGRAARSGRSRGSSCRRRSRRTSSRRRR